MEYSWFGFKCFFLLYRFAQIQRPLYSTMFLATFSFLNWKSISIEMQRHNFKLHQKCRYGSAYDFSLRKKCDKYQKNHFGKSLNTFWKHLVCIDLYKSYPNLAFDKIVGGWFLELCGVIFQRKRWIPCGYDRWKKRTWMYRLSGK